MKKIELKGLSGCNDDCYIYIVCTFAGAWWRCCIRSGPGSN